MLIHLEDNQRASSCLKREVGCTLSAWKGSLVYLMYFLQTTFNGKRSVAKLALTSFSLCFKKNGYFNTSRQFQKKFTNRESVNFDMHPRRHPHAACQGVELKTEKREEQIGLDISSGSGERRGYILSRTMSQPLMGQRSDALISLIDGLEAYNSQQRKDDQENSGERERSFSKQSE